MMATSTKISPILSATKELLGLPVEADEFDSQLVVYINMVFNTLDAIGFSGGTVGYQITASSGDLEEYASDDEAIRSTVQMYIYTKVRLLFDPPTSSFVMTALQATISEYEWRLSMYTPPSE